MESLVLCGGIMRRSDLDNNRPPPFSELACLGESVLRSGAKLRAKTLGPSSETPKKTFHLIWSQSARAIDSGWERRRVRSRFVRFAHATTHLLLLSAAGAFTFTKIQFSSVLHTWLRVDPKGFLLLKLGNSSLAKKKKCTSRILTFPLHGNRFN